MLNRNQRQALLMADRTNTVIPIANTIADILKADPSITMADIEKVFREWHCKTYLVAWPAALVVPGQAKHFDGRPARFALWVCVNGEADMRAQVAEFGLTVEENRAALAECGFNCI